VIGLVLATRQPREKVPGGNAQGEKPHREKPLAPAD
jgi:hypothetical protein